MPLAARLDAGMRVSTVADVQSRYDIRQRTSQFAVVSGLVTVLVIVVWGAYAGSLARACLEGGFGHADWRGSTIVDGGCVVRTDPGHVFHSITGPPFEAVVAAIIVGIGMLVASPVAFSASEKSRRVAGVMSLVVVLALSGIAVLAA